MGDESLDVESRATVLTTPRSSPFMRLASASFCEAVHLLATTISCRQHLLGDPIFRYTFGLQLCLGGSSIEHFERRRHVGLLRSLRTERHLICASDEKLVSRRDSILPVTKTEQARVVLRSVGKNKLTNTERLATGINYLLPEPILATAFVAMPRL